MIRLILTAAALAVAGPALAGSQLESLLDVTPGAHSRAQLAKLHLARADDEHPRVYFETPGALVISGHDLAPRTETRHRPLEAREAPAAH